MFFHGVFTIHLQAGMACAGNCAAYLRRTGVIFQGALLQICRRKEAEMGSYDMKRLETALQYIKRMAGGRNPVTNRPAPENEVLTNANVHRCLSFVEEILQDVKSTGGVVGKAQRVSGQPKPGIAETFPYGILREYTYEEDRQISRFLGQLAGYLPEGQKMPVPATMITNWLRENGYLEKRMMEDTGKENSVPTEKGRELGLYQEKAGFPPNEYYRVYYNAKAQQFLIDHFQKILTESEKLKKKRRDERKQQRMEEGGGRRQNPFMAGVPVGQDSASAAMTPDKAPSAGKRGGLSYEEDPEFASLLSSAPASLEPVPAPLYEEDPDFASLLSSVPESRDPGTDHADYFSASDTPGEGWEIFDEGLPWQT